MTIGICYKIYNKRYRETFIVNNLTDYMFNTGWRIRNEMPAIQSNQIEASNSADYFDNLMYSDYIAKTYP